MSNGFGKEMGSAAMSMIPFSWVQDEVSGMKNAKSWGEYAKHLAIFSICAGLDTAALAATLASEGMAAPAALPLSMAAKSTTKRMVDLAAKMMVGVVEEKYGARAAGRIANDIDASAARMANAENVHAVLTNLREVVPFKDNVEMWRSLKGEVGEGLKLFPDAKFSEKLLKEARKAGDEFTFLVLDKSKTWQLNALGKEFGDVGLAIYFRAAAKVAEKYKDAGVHLIRTTKEGDELVVVYSGSNKELEKKIVDEMKGEAIKLAQALGLDNPKLREAFGGFSSHAITATAKLTEDNTAKLIRNGKEISLDTLLNKAEVEPLLGKLSAKSRETIGKFVNLQHGELPKSLEGKIKFDAFAMFRIGMDETSSKAFLELTENAQKGVAHVQLKSAGPSVFNLAGHSVTDFMTSKYFETLQKTFKKHGIDSEIHSAGPMCFGFMHRGKVDGKTLETAVKEADAIFLKETKELGITKVSSATGLEKEIAEKKITTALIGKEFDNAAINNMRQNIVILQNDRKMFVNMLDGAKIPIGDKEKAMKLLTNLPGWVRTEIELYQHLTNNGLKNDALSIMKAMGDKNIALYDWMKKGVQASAAKRTGEMLEMAR